MYANLNALCVAIHEGQDVSDLVRVYFHAKYEEAPRLGFVGVGCITYAERALVQAQEGVA